MFLVKREYFNKTNIIKGLIIAFGFSAFIYLAYFGIFNKTINSIFAIVSLYFILTSSRQVAFYIGFFIGIFWFYWVSISLQYYELTFFAPIVVILFGLGFAVIFYIINFIDNIFLRALLIFSLSYIHPLGFNWFIPELVFIDTYFSIEKEYFAVILASLVMFNKLKRYKFLAVFPLIFVVLNSNSNSEIKQANIKIDMPKYQVSQDKKWLKHNLSNIVEQNLKIIDNSIKEEKELVILPETVFPILLNHDTFLMEKLLEKSLKINIIAGSLFYEDDNFYNATYFFSKGKVEIAKKYVLVPFGEEIPFPQFLVDIINEIFYNGAKDYKKADKPTDFLIKGEKFRNAICYEATSDKIFENLGDTKYMIAISNNAWFTPSIEPTLQKLLLKYYAKKYNVIIYHQINGSENYIVKP
jgi:apolipoprotein N-acyltransferase